MDTVKLLIKNGFVLHLHTSSNGWDKNESFITYECNLRKGSETMVHRFNSQKAVDSELRALLNQRP
jgi:hypothetical protein